MIADVAQAVNQLNQVLKHWTVEGNPLINITVSHEAFDRLVVQAYKDPLWEGNNFARSTFTPSDAHEFSIVGIRIKPGRKEV